MKICIYFLAIKFCLILQYYSLHSCLLSDPFCIILLILFHTVLYASNKISKFCQNSFVKILYILIHFWKHYTQWFDFSIIFKTNELFKTLFIKRNFVKYHSFINVCVFISSNFQNNEIYIIQYQYYHMSIFLLIFYTIQN